jgi:hypothetical protein
MSDQIVDNAPEQAQESVDVSRLEGLLEDLSKAITTTPDQSSTEIIAKGADAIVSQNKELVERMDKSLALIEERFATLLAKFDAIEGINEKVEKGFAELASQPLAPKAVTVEAEVAPAEVVEAAPSLSKADVLSKAIAELQSTNDPSRVSQLRKGISRLESNFNPADVAADLSY